jgi:hypothetical protein
MEKAIWPTITCFVLITAIVMLLRDYLMTSPTLTL